MPPVPPAQSIPAPAEIPLPAGIAPVSTPSDSRARESYGPITPALQQEPHPREHDARYQQDHSFRKEHSTEDAPVRCAERLCRLAALRKAARTPCRSEEH